jgi:CMP-N-acetylneuraminic acid synthetase
MFAGLRVLGLIPARGGSKGVPRKNLRPLGGRPLVEWSIDTARSTPAIDRVLLSTDDPEIAETGRRAGADVPFLRPEELARDDTPTIAVLQHALRWLETRGDPYDVVALLQPTSPFRPTGLVESALAVLAENDATSVISVRAVPAKFNPHWVFLPGNNGCLRLATGGPDPIPRRQELPPAVIRDGMLYLVRTEVVLQEGTLYGRRCFPISRPAMGDVNLDTLQDFEQAERMLSGREGAVSAA